MAQSEFSPYNQVCLMPLEIDISEVPPVQVVTLRGRLDSAGAPSFETCMNQLTGSAQHIVLDCSDLRYVSSVGLGLFVASAKVLQAKGGELCFASLTQQVRSVFEMVGFLGLFPVHPSVSESLRYIELRGS